MDRDTLLKIDNLMREDMRTARPTTRDLPITDYAIGKAKTYAKIICRLAAETQSFSQGWEGYGYLLKDEWASDDIISEIIFAKDQRVQSAYVRVSEEGVRQATEEAAALGYQVMGWWHSHGNLPVFHSGTDRDNFITITHAIAPHTMFLAEGITPVRQGEHLYFGDYRVHAPEGAASGMGAIEYRRKRDPIAFSMVVNKRGEHYVERREKDLATGDLRETRVVGARIVPVQQTYDIPTIEDDIRRKLHLRPATRRKGSTIDPQTLETFSRHCLNYITSSRNMELEDVVQGILSRGIEEVFTGRHTSHHTAHDTTHDTPHAPTEPGYAGESREAAIEPTPDAIAGRLDELLARTDRERGQTRDAHDLHSWLLERFVRANDIDTIGTYTRTAAAINEAHEQAKAATRALCRYAMLPLSNGKGDIEDSRRLNYLLTRLNTDERTPITRDLTGTDETGTSGGKTGTSMFLYHDRQRIYRQILAGKTQSTLTGAPNRFLESLLSFSREIGQQPGTPGHANRRLFTEAAR